MIRARDILAIGALASCLITTGLGAQERSVLELLDVSGRMVQPGAAQVGEISEADYVFQNGERVQAWGLAVTEPGTWRVDLSSSDFDTYLRVLGPGLGLGESDDDGGEGLNSSLCLDLQPGNYRLVASGLFGNMGRYSLQVLQAGDQAACEAVDGSSGVEMDPEDMTPQGRLRPGESGTAILTEAVTFLEEPAQSWILQGTAGERVRVLLDSDEFDPYLYLDGPGLEVGANYDDDGGCGLGSLIEVTLPESGDYLIVATSFFGTVGSYTVSVLGADDPEPSCDDDDGDDDFFSTSRLDLSGTAAVGSIEVGTTRLGTLDGGSDQVDGANADVWTFAGRAGQSVAITLGADFDPKVWLIGSALSEDYYDDDGGDGLSSRLCTVIPATGDYEIVVRGFSDTAEGSYTLGIEPDPSPASCGTWWRTDAQRADAAQDFSSTLSSRVNGELEIGGSVRGSLGPGSPMDPNRERPVEPWSLVLTAGQDVSIDERAGFDTWLSVLSPSGEEWSNDDGPCGLNSRVTFTAPESGSYLVMASSLGSRDRSESYELVVGEAPASCMEGVMNEVPAGSVAVGQDVEGSLSDASFQTGRGSPGEVWTLTLDAPSTLVIDQLADFDTWLQLVDPVGEEHTNDDGPCGLNSRIVLRNAPAGEYRIVASALSSSMDGTEPYTLSVSSSERNCSDLPDAPSGGGDSMISSLGGSSGVDFSTVSTGNRRAVLGTEVQGSLSNSDGRLSNDRLAQGWAIELEAGQEVIVELDSDPFDPFLYVVTPDGRRSWSDDDSGEGTNSRVRVSAEVSGTYMIVVSAFSGTGEFSLRSWRVVR